MKFIYLTLLVLFLHISIVSAIAGGDSVVGVDLSFDVGTTYSDQIAKVFLCSSTSNDQIKTYGSSTELWGRNWTVDELNNANFRARLNLTNQAGSDTLMKVDHIQVKVYYIPPVPVLTYQNATPANNSNIGATLRVNVSSDQDLVNCKLQHNATGSFQNVTMDIVTSTTCSIDIFHIANNGSGFQFEVFGDAGADENSTEIRNVNVLNTPPSLVISSPQNHTVTIDNFMILKVSISDFENDLMRISIWGDNETVDLNENFIYFSGTIGKGTYTYNFTSPLVQNLSTGLFALYHLDNRSEFGESDTLVFDFSRNNLNGTISSSSFSNAFANESGYFAGAYQFDNDQDRIRIGVNDEFNDTCSGSGCTFSAWINAYSTGDRIIARAHSNLPSETAFFDLFVSSDLLRFDIWDDGSTNKCRATNSSTTINLNTWYNVVGVFDNSSSEISTYVNGILTNVSACDIDIDQSAWNGDRDTFIGAKNAIFPEVALSWDGLIDEVAIWNRVLSSNEILDLYRLAAGKYFWNVTVTDGEFGNASDSLDFHVLYDGGNLEIDCSERLTLAEDLDGDSGANMSITGNGDFTINGANITGFSDYIFKRDASKCEGFVIVSGRLG